MKTNKVILNDDVLIDLTSDTVTAEDVKKGVTFHGRDGEVYVGAYESASEGDPDNLRALYGNWEIVYPDGMGYMLRNNMDEGKPSSVSQDINFTVMTDGGVEESFSGMTIGYVLEFDNGPGYDPTWEGCRIIYKTSLGTEIVVWEQNFYDAEITYPSPLGENFKNVSFGKEAQCVSQAFFDVFAYYESGYDESGGGEYEEYHCKFLGCGECEVPDIELSISGNYVIAEAKGERVAEYNVVQAEPDIKPANIKKGVNIFNVTGSYEPTFSDIDFSVSNNGYVVGIVDDEPVVEYELPSLAEKRYTPGTTAVTINKDQWLTGDQIILGDADLKAENIKKAVNIFGVIGTYEGGSTATATLKYDRPVPDSMFTVLYYDPSTGEKKTYTLASGTNDTVTVPCNVGITMYIPTEEYYAPFSAGMHIRVPGQATSSNPDPDPVELPFEEHNIFYCPGCNDKYGNTTHSCEDGGYFTHYVVSFCIPDTYAGTNIHIDA